MIILLSVPHTGTRFSMKFLNAMGTTYRNYHSSPKNFDNIRHIDEELFFDNLSNLRDNEKKGITPNELAECELGVCNDIYHETVKKTLIPVRDPLLAYASRWLRVEGRRCVLKDVVFEYKLLLIMENWFEEKHYLNLDTENREAELKATADFCGHTGPMPDFLWEPVGSLKPSPTDYLSWDLIADEIGQEKADEVLNKLAPYREHYGY